jgi:hypothetical protein
MHLLIVKFILLYVLPSAITIIVILLRSAHASAPAATDTAIAFARPSNFSFLALD